MRHCDCSQICDAIISQNRALQYMAVEKKNSFERVSWFRDWLRTLFMIKLEYCQCDMKLARVLFDFGVITTGVIKTTDNDC